MRRLARLILIVALAAALAGSAAAQTPPRYDRHVMRACFAAMPDVVEAVSPLPRRVAPLTTVLRQNVLYVSFLIPFGNESLTHAVLIFGTNENDARTRGELILLAARANPELPPPSVAGANGNLAFFTLGELTRSIAGELKTCFTRSARAPFAL